MTTLLATLPDDVRQAMIEHAGAEQPRECCGLLVRDTDAGTLHYMRAENLYRGLAGEDRFLLDPEAWAAAEAFGDVLAVVHSHPHASANPSMADRVQCERSGLPWIVVGWPSGMLVELAPSGWSAPLEGREFHHGVLDCYTLVQDWYWRELAIALPDFDREDGWWERGGNLYRANLERAGFVEVGGQEPQRGDGLLMRVRSPEVDNHAAVYLGDGYMLHHLYGQLSRRERWDWPWQRRTTAIVRHRSLLEGAAALERARAAAQAQQQRAAGGSAR
jgi:proteasome lid subunit RPN8/RPN11